MRSTMVWLALALGAAGVWWVWVDWSAYSQETPAAKDELIELLDGRVRSFFESISQGTTLQAYENLLRGSPLLGQKPDALKTLADRTAQIPNRFGKFRGFERLDARRVGKDLIFFRYIYKCEDFPVAWSIAFYRAISRPDSPPDETAWRVILVRFDTDLEQLARL
ncbi:MAG: hypothetical protein NZ602_17275 [Thermoguttaceae bacterium]|nr:hypothetical protein [Thermoguttaceae bacterium]MDW8037657.1 hypothetical protein [Thermoguttaceae bacterium]